MEQFYKFEDKIIVSSKTYNKLKQNENTTI